MILHTERLRLEPCNAGHYDGLRVVNTDLEVMRFLGGAQTPEETRAWIERAEAGWAALGYSWWSIILAESGRIIGAGCIQHIENDPAKAVEIGWRLLPDTWGKGYATEAARAMAAFAFRELPISELFSNADPQNAASIHVMQRIGMRFVGRRHYYGSECATYAMDRPGPPDAPGR